MQGVYYRRATAARARELALAGWVQNLPDGRVEVVASGPIAVLAVLAEWLWQGPPSARVDSVTLEEWTSAVPPGFSVR